MSDIYGEIRDAIIQNPKCVFTAVSLFQFIYGWDEKEASTAFWKQTRRVIGDYKDKITVFRPHFGYGKMSVTVLDHLIVDAAVRRIKELETDSLIYRPILNELYFGMQNEIDPENKLSWDPMGHPIAKDARQVVLLYNLMVDRLAERIGFDPFDYYKGYVPTSDELVLEEIDEPSIFSNLNTFASKAYV